MEYGYTRVSRKSQNIERQIRNIKQAYPNALIIQEAWTGTTIDRKEFNKLLTKVKPGDTIIFDSVSRFSRNAEEGFELYEKLYRQGVQLVFLKEHQIDTATYQSALASTVPQTGTAVDLILEGVNKYLMVLAKQQIKLAFDQAQKEVDDLHQRTKEGIETARLNGKQIGQKPGRKLTTKKSVAAKEKILKHSKDFGGSLGDKDCIELTGVSRKTFYAYKKQLKQERQQS